MTLSPETLAALAEADLDAAYVEALAVAAVEEDLAGGVDVTSTATVPADLLGTAAFVPRQAGVVAGIPVAMAVLDAVGDVEFLSRTQDGIPVQPGTSVLDVRGPVRVLLTAERSALNLLCHLSGIATLTRQWADAIDGTGAHVRDTRKTTPGLRLLEKYAVRCGGGVNHRMALSDAALVKDNHVVAAGGVAAAFDAVRAQFPDLEVEVECDTVEQVREVVAAGADLVLLDNMPVAEMRAAVEVCRAAGVRTEASGGLRLDNARAVAETGVDFLAVGALTHSAPVLDLGVDLRTT
ncbi:MAG: carboxylating nicotinate-nucleotide diphosphorylase [Actinobacteria bacterium]|nr:carboxylating nicotinate-nucleotide diphosphorylase [Actinomycetota bacterium]MCA1720411.1 carboxylating nicotinate-nucleotide diphosphorylase [Actinomycetota bacterium]